MKILKKYKTKIIAGVIIAAVLAFVYWWGGDSPGLRGWNPQSATSSDTIYTPSETAEQPAPAEMPDAEQSDGNTPEEAKVSDTDSSQDSPTETPPDSADAAQKNAEYSANNGMVLDSETGKDKYLTDPVPVGKPVPVEPQDAVLSDKELTCTLSVRCDTILANMAWLDPEKTELVPEDGVIYAEKTVTFYQGESVFNLLLREMKKHKIHMEFVNTPIYNSAYIEGINNIYEFDCGELSGWMYKVNGWFPNYGCSRYQLKAGDKVEWVYTCDLGVDVGGNYAASGGQKNE